MYSTAATSKSQKSQKSNGERESKDSNSSGQAKTQCEATNQGQANGFYDPKIIMAFFDFMRQS
jgi:hypothetical protein